MTIDDSPGKGVNSKDVSINQSRDINLSIHDERIIASSSSRRMLKVKSDPKIKETDGKQKTDEKQKTSEKKPTGTLQAKE